MSDVSRSVYQKVCEENKRLKADIEVLTSGKFDNEYIVTLLKYRKIFRKESEFRELMKTAAMQYMKDHPEYHLDHFHKTRFPETPPDEVIITI